MQVAVTNREGVVIYSQLEESTPDRMNAVISHLMAETRGTLFTTKVSNNGHELAFNHQTIDIKALVKVVNGIATRKPAAVIA